MIYWEKKKIPETIETTGQKRYLHIICTINSDNGIQILYNTIIHKEIWTATHTVGRWINHYLSERF